MQAPSDLSETQIYVTAAAHGESWPFIIDDGIVECIEPKQIVFHHGDVTYALNGEARDQMVVEGWQDPTPLQREVQQWVFFTGPASLDSLVEVGMSLCEPDSPFRSSMQGFRRNDSD